MSTSKPSMPVFQRLRSFASSRMSSQIDLEKTVVGETTHSEQPQENIPRQTEPSNHVPTVPRTMHYDLADGEALAKFRHFVGIHNDPSLITARVVPNAGIYPRVVQAEKMHHRNYTTFAWLINGALGLQIVFAAALTALGAGNGPRSAITAFGAMNTIIAGFLTFLKGSGLPNRFKYYENEMLKLREYIEQREREFARGELHSDILKEEIILIETMYEDVRRDIEANTPDNYTSLTKASNAASSSSAHDRLSRQFAGARSKFDDIRQGFDDRRRDLEQGYRETRSGIETSYGNNRRDLERTYNDNRTTVEQSYHKGRHDMELKLDNTRHGLEEQVTNVRRGIDSEVNGARRGLEAEVQGLGHRVDQERQGLEHRIEDEKKGIEARMSGVETKVHETEEKALAMAEKIAEKVLSITQKKRDEGHG